MMLIVLLTVVGQLVAMDVPMMDRFDRFIDRTKMEVMTKTERLAMALTRRHLRFVHPMTGDTSPMTLHTNIYMMCADMDPSTHTYTTRVVEKFTWMDPRLKWTPSEYDGIKMIHLPSNMIWTPDIKVYNAPNMAERRDDVNVIVTSDGMVTWMPVTTYRTHCKVTPEPTFDPTFGRNERNDRNMMRTEKMSASCSITLGSWTFNERMMMMKSEERVMDMSGYLKDTCPFTISNPSVKVESKTYTCCPDQTYSTMLITFDMKQRENM